MKTWTRARTHTHTFDRWDFRRRCWRGCDVVCPQASSGSADLRCRGNGNLARAVLILWFAQKADLVIRAFLALQQLLATDEPAVTQIAHDPGVRGHQPLRALVAALHCCDVVRGAELEVQSEVWDRLLLSLTGRHVGTHPVSPPAHDLRQRDVGRHRGGRSVIILGWPSSAYS